MKQTINIRGCEDKQKVGSYQVARQSIKDSAIKQIEKKAIQTSTNPQKYNTMKHILQQEENTGNK